MQDMKGMNAASLSSVTVEGVRERCNAMEQLNGGYCANR